MNEKKVELVSVLLGGICGFAMAESVIALACLQKTKIEKIGVFAGGIIVAELSAKPLGNRIEEIIEYIFDKEDLKTK